MANEDISVAKLEANRENSKKSTGPKDTSITKLNALKHGLLSKEVLISGEKGVELEELGRRIRLDLAPEGQLEMILVDRIVSTLWRLRRALRIESEYLEAEYEDCRSDKWSGDERNSGETWNLLVGREMHGGSAWLNLLRYETTLERQIYKALHELQRLQGARRGEKSPIPIAIDVDVNSEA